MVDDVSIRQVGTCTVTQSHNSGAFPVGTTPVTYTFDDGNGNISTCNFDVEVVDDEDPVINCPEDVTVSSASANGAIVTYDTPEAEDNCAVTLTQIAGLSSGSLFPPGTTTNTFVATDVSGNTDTCSFNVIVDQTTNTQINIRICVLNTWTIYRGSYAGVGPLGPQRIKLYTSVSGGTPGYTYSWSPAAGLSNPTIANPKANPTSTTTYTLTITDYNGATNSLSVTIKVLPLSSAVCHNNCSSHNGNGIKFMVCHIPPGNPSNAHNICISKNALKAHLKCKRNGGGHGNCYLGPCQDKCVSTSNNCSRPSGLVTVVEPFDDKIMKSEMDADMEEMLNADDDSFIVEDLEVNDAFKVNVYPNPSAGVFNVMVNSNNKEPISIKVTDITGKVISVTTNALKGSLFKLGNDLRGGIYIAEITQGANKKTLRLVKLN